MECNYILNGSFFPPGECFVWKNLGYNKMLEVSAYLINKV